MASEIILPGNPAFGNNNLWAKKSGSVNTYQAVESVGGALRVVTSPDTSSGAAATQALTHANVATYMATGKAYAGYATPTDMLQLIGGVGKVIRIKNMWMQIQSTAAAMQAISFIKRSALNTGGTASNPAAVKVDSTDGAAVATVNLYSVIPSGLGASVGNMADIQVLSGTAATPGGIASLQAFMGEVGVTSLSKPVTLNGAAESLAINYGGAALTAGFSANWGILWTEEAT